MGWVRRKITEWKLRRQGWVPIEEYSNMTQEQIRAMLDEYNLKGPYYIRGGKDENGNPKIDLMGV